MSLLAAALLVLACLGSGWLFGLAVLGCAVWLFAAVAGLALSLPQLILLGALFLMIPAAAYLAGLLLDRFAWRTLDGQRFAGIALAFACMAALRSDLLFNYIEAALVAVRGPVRPLLLLGAAVNATLLCASVTALCIMTVQLVIELPFHWLRSASRAPLVMPFKALRPLLVCAALTLLVQHAAGMFAAELRPERIVRAAERP